MSTHEITIQAYDSYADNYDRAIIEFWDKFPKDFINLFAASLQGKRVLNLGSGSGRDALLLRALGLEVVCVDASISMVNITTQLGFETYHTSFRDMSFPQGSFDGIWAYGSLLHISRKEAAVLLEHIKSLLRPKGTCALGVIQGKGSALVGHSITPDAKRYFQYYTHQELITLASRAGFTLLNSQEYDVGYDIFLNHLYCL